MDTLHASTFDLEPQAATSGGDGDARNLTAIERTKQALRFLRRNLFWTFVAILVATVVGGLAYLRTWPPMAIVQSGSMVPTINIGDVEILKRLDGPPKVGEIVVVHVPDAVRSRFGYPPVVSHRIIKIARNGNITTKGDALKTADPFITQRGTVTEQVVAVIPDAGRIFGFFTSTWGMLWMVVGALLLVGLPVLDRRREQEAHERETMVTLQTQLETLTRELVDNHTTSPPAAAPRGSLESELRALVDQAASTQQTLAGATAALEEQHEQQKRLTEELIAAPRSPTTPHHRGPAAKGSRPGSPESPASLSWSWAVVAAAAAVFGCRFGGRRQASKPPQWWSSPPAWWNSPPPSSTTRSSSGRKASTRRPRSRP
jgi:signal peptidase I